MPRMGKIETDWNKGFWKLFSLTCTIFQSWSLAFATSKTMLRRHICLSPISDFCHFYVISLFTLSSTAIEGEQLAKLNKMNWTAVTQPLKRTSWNYLPWVVVNPSGSKYMAIFLSNIFVTLFQLENRSKAKFEALWGCPPGGDVPNWHSFFHKCNRIISI